MKYGLVINDQIICEPISDHSQLLNIAKQKGRRYPIPALHYLVKSR